ncbi:transglycosylase family protein [Streptomyces sp. WMMB303]|uniref:transglycosylase family protein n=1 Tax=Streptomyces sp. WMMB303 TaxID=3034154 RepID=UPI0023ED4D1F|nr:transglycosylase family protein [Streptomyces sp. WMMB303]MDF4252397.1 transglycosylase family protein [Streptomyces sp. WMMB303]
MSAHGRHRRHQPRAVSRVSLRVTAGGAGIALPLVGAQAADAAARDVWEKVAACESSGNWNTATGNGYYGGLQFSSSTWEAYGGTAYAAGADQATKDQQIAVAEKVLEGQGPGAWPTCGPRAGLVRGDAAPAAARDDSGGQADAAGPARAEQAAQAKADRARAERGKKLTTYQVVGGDTLSGIAQENEVAGGWHTLYESNRSTIGDDPDLILPGQRLSLTGSPRRTERPPSRARGSEDAAAPKAPRQRAEKRSAAKKKQQPPEKHPRKDTREQVAKQAPAHRDSPSATAPVSGVAPSTAYRATGGSWSSGHHTGVDFPVGTGTSVEAVTSGTVVSAGWGGAYGYQVVLRHRDGKYSQYGHLSAISVRSGQAVRTGQRLGRSGATGNATGPHLHFEVRTGPGYGSDINPLAYLRGRGVRI